MVAHARAQRNRHHPLRLRNHNTNRGLQRTNMSRQRREETECKHLNYTPTSYFQKGKEVRVCVEGGYEDEYGYHQYSKIRTVKLLLEIVKRRERHFKMTTF